jgi:hypothetical protein
VVFRIEDWIGRISSTVASRSRRASRRLSSLVSFTLWRLERWEGSMDVIVEDGILLLAAITLDEEKRDGVQDQLVAWAIRVRWISASGRSLDSSSLIGVMCSYRTT